MAGPVSIILLPVPVTDALKEAVLADIRTMTDHVEPHHDTYDFWLQKRPLSVYFNPEDYYEGDAARVLGWKPKGYLGSYAGCNRPEDHRLLGEVNAHFARKFDGWVDLGWELESEVQGLPGHILVVTHEEGGTSHICDADFMEAWLRHPGFWMMK